MRRRPAVELVSGAWVSGGGGGGTIANECEAGVGSVLAAASVARTSKVWSPRFRSPGEYGELQVAKAPPSIRHSKVDAPSEEENEKVGDVSVLDAGGPLSIVVCGASFSTRTIRHAAVLVSPPPSVATASIT